MTLEGSDESGLYVVRIGMTFDGEGEPQKRDFLLGVFDSLEQVRRAVSDYSLAQQTIVLDYELCRVRLNEARLHDVSPAPKEGSSEAGSEIR